MADTFTPPADVARNARLALDVRATKPPSQQGMTPVGLARANQLANRDPVSLDTVQRMVSYFARHEVDKQGSTWDQQGKGWQAWFGWGGDEGRTWANQIMKENAMETKASRRHSEADMKRIRAARRMAENIKSYMVELGDDMMDDDEAKTTLNHPPTTKQQALEIVRLWGVDFPDSASIVYENMEMLLQKGMAPKEIYDRYAVTPIKSMHEMSAEFNTRQRMMVSSLIEVTHEAGKFDKGIGANGAHYMEAAKNPFASQGMACEHCYFYQPDGNCAIVEGIIEEYAVCKLWIIPEAVIMMETMESTMEMSDVVPMEAEMETEEAVAMTNLPLDTPLTIEVGDNVKALARRLLGGRQ